MALRESIDKLMEKNFSASMDAILKYLGVNCYNLLGTLLPCT